MMIIGMKIVKCGCWFSLNFRPLLKTKEVLFSTQASSFLKNVLKDLKSSLSSCPEVDTLYIDRDCNTFRILLVCTYNLPDSDFLSSLSYFDKNYTVLIEIIIVFTMFI